MSAPQEAWVTHEPSLELFITFVCFFFNLTHAQQGSFLCPVNNWMFVVRCVSCMQVSALDDLKTQMGDSLELQLQLQTRATSLEETQALVTEELRVQKAEYAKSLRQATLDAAVVGADGRAGPPGAVGLVMPPPKQIGNTHQALHLHQGSLSIGRSIVKCVIAIKYICKWS